MGVELSPHRRGEEAVHAYVIELFDMLSVPGAIGYAGVLVREYLRLVEHHQDELQVALQPLFEHALGMTMHEMFRHFNSAGYPLARTRSRFIRPTRYGDDVVVDSTIEFGRASFTIEHRLIHDNLTCVQCSETRVWVVHDPERPGEVKSQPVPEAVLEKFRG